MRTALRSIGFATKNPAHFDRPTPGVKIRLQAKLMAVSGISISLAWLLLAFAHSYWLFLLAYGLFLGPALAVGGPVTRYAAALRRSPSLPP
jgi:hypothetical protein